MALEMLGLHAAPDDVAELFAEFDGDNSGSVS
jgi:hypothetical protein